MEQKDQNLELPMSRTEERRWRETEGSTFERVRSGLSEKLSGAAQVLHEKVAGSGKQTEITNLGNRAADWLERSADYVKDVEPQQIRSDIEAQVRRNPGRSLLIAGVVGLILGRVIRGR
jgi:ElaB/YqjD/DUF883 family membrane-anchored ribosome-binding protein